MTQEEFKVFMEVAKDAANVPNNRLEQTMDKLAEEFENINMKGKTCLITGANSGIGFKLAELFA